MKKTLIVASLIAAVGAMAQGTIIPANFSAASDLGPAVNVPFTEKDTGAKLWNAYQAQLMVGLTEGSLAPVGAPVKFSGTKSPGTGYFIGSKIVVDPIAPGTEVKARVDVFPVGFASYDDAVAAGEKVGKSNVLTLTLGGVGAPPTLPTNLYGLQAVEVAVIPEPSVLALVGLGAAALLLRRRK